MIAFARDVLGQPLEPWQEVAVIRGGELLADGITPRFRKVLLIVSRQSGKTYLLSILADFWLFVEQWPLLLGLHSSLAMTRESWELAQTMAEAAPLLAGEFGKVRSGNNDPQWMTAAGPRYKIAAATRKGGRGLSVDRLIFDELREQRDWVAYSAAMPAMTARPYAQAWLISNQGDENSEVLNTLRTDAIAGIEGREADPELGLIEWSAPEGAEADDPEAVAAACPRLGRGGRTLDSYLAEARQSLRAGGKALAAWRTEYLCQYVKSMNPAYDAAAWLDGANGPADLVAARGRVVLCLDVSRDERHATLVAAATIGDRVAVVVAGAWDDLDVCRRELPGVVERVKPKTLGWFPNGPAAALAADLADRTKQGRHAWPPRGVTVQEIRGEVAAVVMGLGEQITARRVAHNADPLLDAHVTAAERVIRGDTWVLNRKGGHVDAAYAVAGAVHLARTLPTGLGELRIVTIDDED